MSTNALSGYGVTLAFGNGDGPPETFTTVAELIDALEGPNLAADAIEVTAHSDSGWRTFIPGLKDAGEVSASVNLIPDNSTHDPSTGLISMIGVQGNWKVTFPDTTTATFSAILTAFEPSSPLDDRLTASITLKLSGAPTWA
jgi:predicted secreted protein